jgi:Integrase zinc binding domain/Integrase core domain
MLTRWAAPTKLVRVSNLVLATTAPTEHDAFVWPTAQEIRLVQDTALVGEQVSKGHSHPEPLLSDDSLYRTSGGQVWIPAAAHDLQLRICIVAHTGGHRGIRATTDSIKALFFWPKLVRDVRTFCNTCLHCRSTIGGNRTPRPFGQALHASLPNEIIHFDFLYMGPSQAGFKYLLLIKDDLSGYIWLIPCVAADTAATVDALTLWFAAFGVALIWVSDRGTYFKNNVFDAVRRALRSQPHFTTAYSP